MKHQCFVLLGILCLSLVGCATPYQRLGTDESGGFCSQRLAESRFSVGFSANGFTEPRTAYDYTMLRAAELTLEYKYAYFAIEGEHDKSSSEVVSMGSTSYTTGTVSPYGSYSGYTTTSGNSIPIYKPGYVINISCFEEPPKGRFGKIYSAVTVAAELKKKYGIK